MTKDTEALREALEQVKQLAQRDMARTQTDFIGRMGQELCDFEAAIEPYPDGDLPDDVRGDAYDAIAGLAGLSFAQMLMLRGCDHTIFDTPDTIGSHFGNGGGGDPGAELGFDPTVEVGDEVFPHDAGEPVAWLYEIAGSGVWRLYKTRYISPQQVAEGWTETPLYAHPPHPAPVDPVAGWEALREALRRAALRLEICAGYIDSSFGLSGTRRAERAMKAKHFALEALAALKGPAA